MQCKREGSDRQLSIAPLSFHWFNYGVLGAELRGGSAG
ncbi:hypothetical protein NIES2104_40960 [Leptolyngbya sp. NIES-2104]|nr:hypothetical protein NIES2104_40960 [Leptolyngbya sp. NIES-2104]